ncbi:MAG: hypothetical protein ACYDBQ_08585 [Thermoplasmatota archaeon]
MVVVLAVGALAVYLLVQQAKDANRPQPQSTVWATQPAARVTPRDPYWDAVLGYAGGGR